MATNAGEDACGPRRARLLVRLASLKGIALHVALICVHLRSSAAKYFSARDPRCNICSATPYKPVKVDRRLKDGEIVKLGDVQMQLHLTPGHTEGNSAWTTVVNEGGRKLNVVFAASMSIQSRRTHGELQAMAQYR